MTNFLQVTSFDPLIVGGGTSPVQSVAGKVGAVSLVKSDVGLDQVDNTSDVNKPISTAQANGLAPMTVNGKLASRKDSIKVDVRDWGVVGDGTSRPLSGIYGTLAAAQAVYPAALALTDELDWAAMQSCVNANPNAWIYVHPSLTVLVNRPVTPLSNTRWTVDGIIKNNWPYNSPSIFQDRASAIRLGNLHPAVVKPGSGYTWNSFPLNAVNAGDRILTVTTPGGVAGAGNTINVGDKVIVCAMSNPDPAGIGYTYDYEQINKVIAWNNSTGALELELPCKVTIPTGTALSVGQGGAPATPVLTLGTTNTTGGRFVAAGTYQWVLSSFNGSGESAGSAPVSAAMLVAGTQVLNWSAVTGSPTGYKLYRIDPNGQSTLVATVGVVTTYTDIGTNTVMSSPKLFLVTGADTSNSQNWFCVDNFKLDGKGKLIGVTPFGMKMWAWRCNVDIAVDAQDLLSAQSATKSVITVRGRFTNRAMELKMVAQDNTITVDGVYYPDPTGLLGSALTTVSVGEQANGNTINLDVHRGSEHTSNVRLLEAYAQDNTIVGRLQDYSTGGQTEVVALKSTGNIARPPQDQKLDLVIRTKTGKTSYMLIGNDQNGDGLVNDADPTRTSYKLNARSDGLSATYPVFITRGTNAIQENLLSDAIISVVNSVGIEAPERATIKIATISGAPTYAANTETLLGAYTLTGPLVGDTVNVSMQQLLTPTSGTFGDLVLSAAVASAGQVRVYIRNRSATPVVMPAGNAFFVLATWQKGRP